MHWDGSEGGTAPGADVADGARFDLLLEAGRRCLEHAWVRGRAASRMHLIASKLKRPGFVQRGLFEPPEPKDGAVAQAKREINAAAGAFRAAQRLATLALPEVYRDGAQGYDICDIRGKICF